MRTVSLAAIVLALGAGSSRAQDLTEANNVTSLLGTWSSGSGAVQTGGQFCIPSEMSFTYPVNTGLSYSFTDDGFFEEAQFRYEANATNPSCIRGKIIWQHGTYALNSDGSMTLTPFGPDGRIQVQDPCAATTNLVTYYSQVTDFADWGIVIDQSTANYALKLNRFDGAKLPPMYLVARPPNMLPTYTLTGTNSTGQTSTRKRALALEADAAAAKKKRSAATSVSVGAFGVAGSALAAAVFFSI